MTCAYKRRDEGGAEEEGISVGQILNAIENAIHGLAGKILYNFFPGFVKAIYYTCWCGKTAYLFSALPTMGTNLTLEICSTFFSPFTLVIRVRV